MADELNPDGVDQPDLAAAEPIAERTIPEEQAELETLIASDDPIPIDLDEYSVDDTATMVRLDQQPVPLGPAVRKIPGYDILEELGRGGMGVVYRAHDQKLKRIVALKMVLSGALASDVDMQRFQVEAESVARLQHPNIIQIYEVSEYEDQPFIVFEFAACGSLDDAIGNTPQNAEESAALVETLGKALQVVHEQDIVHRDLKPANVLLSEDREPKITDFGLAKQLNHDSKMTRSGAIMGTPSFMAPEQAAGSGDTVGPAADIYALGGILYQLLTGRPPFQAETQMDTLLQVVNEEPVPPRRLNSRIPLDLDTIALKCLEKEPRRRYPTAAALSDDLRRWLDGRPIMSRPINWLERTWRWCKRKPVIAALSAAVVLLLLLGTVVSSYFGIVASREKTLADAARYKAEEREQAARRYAYGADMILTQRDWADANTERMIQTLSRYNDDGVRGFEWFYWNRLCGDDHGTFALREHFVSVNAVAFNSDATLVATGSFDESIIIWNTATREKILTIDDMDDGVRSVAFSLDDELIVAGLDEGGIRIWRVSDGTLVRSLDLHKADVTGICLHPDGSLVASSSADGTVKIWELSSGDVTTTITSEHTFNSVEFHPDGSCFLTADGAAAQVWDVKSGTKELEISYGTTVNAAAFSPSGDHIVTGGGNLVCLWNGKDGSIIHEMTGHRSGVKAVDVSPNGKTIASGGFDNSVRLWDAATGLEERHLKGHTDAVLDLRFSTTGKTLVSGSMDGTARVYDLVSAREEIRLDTGEEEVSNLAVSPDGKHLLTRHSRFFSVTKTKLWSLATGKVLWARSQKEGTRDIGSMNEPGLRRLGFSSDGNLIFYLLNGDVVIADAKTAKPNSVLRGHKGTVIAAEFSPKGDLIATASSRGEAKIWSVKEGNQLLELGGEFDSIEALLFSGDGKQILVSSRERTTVFDSRTGEKQKSLMASGFLSCIAGSPDGRHIAVGRLSNEIEIWNLEKGKHTQLLSGHVDGVSHVAYGPGGERLLSVGGDEKVRLWDVVTGREVLTFDPGIGSIEAAEFSRNGRVIVVLGWEGEIVAWDCGSRTADRRTEVPAKFKVKVTSGSR